MIFLEKCKDLWNEGKVRLPVKYRKRWGYLASILVDVYVEEGNIVIEHATYGSNHNTRYISIEGEVRIPMEFYKIGDIEKRHLYCIYADEEKKRFILSNIEEK